MAPRDFYNEEQSGYFQASRAIFETVRLTGGYDLEGRDELTNSLVAGRVRKSAIKMAPRIGVEYDPKSGIRARVAYFEGRNRTLTGTAALSPATLMGFRQLYDDVADSYTRTFAAGFDATMGSLYAGFSMTARKLSVPVYGDDAWSYDKTGDVTMSPYVYWIASDRSAIAFEPLIERSWQINSSEFDDVGSLHTLALPVSARVFGLSSSTGAATNFLRKAFLDARLEWVRQRGNPGSGGLEAEADETFATLDVSLGVLFPGKLGMIALQCRNITNERFSFVEPTFNRIEPEFGRYAMTRTFQIVLDLHWDR